MDVLKCDVVKSAIDERIKFIPEKLNGKKIKIIRADCNLKSFEDFFRKYVGYNVEITVIVKEEIDDKRDLIVWERKYIDNLKSGEGKIKGGRKKKYNKCN